MPRCDPDVPPGPGLRLFEPDDVEFRKAKIGAHPPITSDSVQNHPRRAVFRAIDEDLKRDFETAHH